MKVKLTQGMFSDPKCNAFGLSYAQVKTNPLFKSAGWFNRKGEKLGYGDLSVQDLWSIANQLHDDDVFLALTEADTIWNIPSDLDKFKPGHRYVFEHAVLGITRYDVYKIKDTYPNRRTHDLGVEVFKTRRDYFFADVNYDPDTEKEAEEQEMPFLTSLLHYGLAVWKMKSSGEKWAVGSEKQINNAAKTVIENDLWSSDFTEISGYWIRPMDQEELNQLDDFTSNNGSKSNWLVKTLLGFGVDAYNYNKAIEHLLSLHGTSYYLCAYDEKLLNSENIPGLPAGNLAFRIS